MINILQRMALVNPDLAKPAKPAKPAEETKANPSITSTPVVATPEMAGLKVAIREIEGQIGAVALDWSLTWTVSQLADELLALEFQRFLLRVADVPVKLRPIQDGIKLEDDQPE